jgi:hypothetical protein
MYRATLRNNLRFSWRFRKEAPCLKDDKKVWTQYILQCFPLIIIMLIFL